MNIATSGEPLVSHSPGGAAPFLRGPLLDGGIDRLRLISELAQVERHIADSEQRIAEQQERTAKLRRDRQNTAAQVDLLNGALPNSVSAHSDP
jgi:septal ring factor EnvC (AmiA/AmiB activator)